MTRGRTWIVAVLRVLSGGLALGLLFLQPDNPFVWPLLILSTASIYPSKRKDTYDVSSQALIIAAIAVCIIVLFLAIPENWWLSASASIPDWAKERTPPVWARVSIAAAWLVLIVLYVKRLKSHPPEAPPNSA